MVWIRMACSVVAVLAFIAPGSGHARPDHFTVDELEALEAERRQAEARLSAIEAAEANSGLDLAKLDAELIAAAQESRRREEQASQAAAKLSDLKGRMISATEALYENEDDLEALLAALVSAGRARPPALIVSPGEANRAVRAALMLSDAAPELSRQAKSLRDALQAMEKLERGIRREEARLNKADAVLVAKREEIFQLAATKRAQFENMSTDAEKWRRRVADLGDRAGSLRELLAGLEADAPTRPGLKPAAPKKYAALNPSEGRPSLPPSRGPQAALRPLGPEALGGFLKPVSGLIAEGYGKRRATGERSKGLTIVTRPEAQVVAPVDGIIEYAGTFRTYGPTLILHTSDNYYVLLSGLGAIYGTPKQQVKAGEPIGSMSTRATPAPQLYFELIKDDRSIDPVRWMKQGR